MKLDHIDVFSLFILRSLGVILFFLLGSWRSLGKDSDTTFTASVEGTYSNNVPFGVAKYPNSHLIHSLGYIIFQLEKYSVI